MSRCRDVEMSRCRDVEMSRCRDVEMSRCRDVEMSRCRDVEMSRCRDVEMSRCRDVEMSRCRDVEMSRCRDVEMSRCRDVEMSRCRDVEMSRCRDVEMSRCRDVEMSRDGRTLKFVPQAQFIMHVPNMAEEDELEVSRLLPTHFILSFLSQTNRAYICNFFIIYNGYFGGILIAFSRNPRKKDYNYERIRSHVDRCELTC